MDNYPNENEQDLSSYQKETIEKIKLEEKRRKQWRKEIKENSALQNYFSQFEPSSVKAFIEHLFTYKNLWVELGPVYLEKMNTRGVEWIELANKHLEVIQQKKLFDMQCLWRAEKIEIKEVQVCYEFSLWERIILNCPFIDPVSEEDIRLYQQYLQSENAEAQVDWGIEWQGYDELKEAYNNDDSEYDFPEWYDFHNGRTGTGVLMTLPDIKGEKEAFYFDIWRNSWMTEKTAQQNEQQEKAETLKHLSYYGDEFMKWYVDTFESKEIQKLYTAYEWSNTYNSCEWLLDEDFRLLYAADEMVPIESNMNWMEGVRKAADKYRCKKISEALPLAWEEYMINIQTGIAFSYPGNTFRDFDMAKKAEIDRLIQGRILNGEPGDLNF